MGKGQRVRESRAAEKEAKRIEAAKKAKKQRTSVIVTSIVAGVLVLCLVAGFIYQTVYTTAFNRGDIQRKTVVMQTENYTVDAAMMSYFFYSQYNSFASSYSDYISSIGLDTAKSLRNQNCTFKSGSTWFEYFCDEAGSQVKEMLYLAEKAVAAGMTLNDEDQAEIQEAIDSYKDYAKENSYNEKKIFSLFFGNGVQESDVRKCMELSTLSGNYLESYKDALSYTDEEIEQYYKDNLDSYRYVDYYSYQIEAEDIEDSKTYAAAKSKADQLAAVPSTDAFAAWVENDIRATTKITEEFTKEDLEENVKETVAGLKTNKATHIADNAASDWLFNTAKVGETYVDDDEGGTYTVYYLTATPYRDESDTKTIRQIIFTAEAHDKDDAAAKAAADEVLAELIEAKWDEHTFEHAAAEHSADTATYGNGGLCENYTKASFDTAVGDWAFAAGRAAGDYELLKIEGGYAICYYVADGTVAWKANCITDKKNDEYTAAYETWTKEITLTENKDGYSKIPDNV